MGLFHNQSTKDFLNNNSNLSFFYYFLVIIQLKEINETETAALSFIYLERVVNSFYKCCVFLRTGCSMCFVRSGAGGFWRLMGFSTTLTISPDSKFLVDESGEDW